MWPAALCNTELELNMHMELIKAMCTVCWRGTMTIYQLLL
jgi:hypothetical protein